MKQMSKRNGKPQRYAYKRSVADRTSTIGLELKACEGCGAYFIRPIGEKNKYCFRGQCSALRNS